MERLCQPHLDSGGRTGEPDHLLHRLDGLEQGAAGRKLVVPGQPAGSSSLREEVVGGRSGGMDYS